MPQPDLAAILPANSRQRRRRGGAAQQQGGALAGAQHRRGRLERGLRNLPDRRIRRRLGDAIGRIPGRIRRQNEGSNLSGRLSRGRNGQRAIPARLAALGEVFSQCDIGAARP